MKKNIGWLRNIGWLSVGLIIGFRASFLLVEQVEEPVHIPASATAVLAGGSEDEASSKVMLSAALQEERDLNHLLYLEIDRLNSEIAQVEVAQIAADQHLEDAFSAGDWLESARADLESDYEPPDRHQMLVSAGYSSDHANRILQRELELQSVAVANHNRDPDASGLMDYADSRVAARQLLRKELGDYEYERYLDATGQSTAISITQVKNDSLAQNAGFQVGDEIVDYDGERVFNMIELADRARDGASGDAVLVNIRRDGAPMQLVVARGPIGISGGK